MLSCSDYIDSGERGSLPIPKYGEIHNDTTEHLIRD